jgi:p-aminobenzoyl-glutamate transporter AbgT
MGNVVLIPLCAMKDAAADLKPLLVGMVAGLASLSIQNFADDTLAHHAVSVMSWLFAALTITAARQIPAETLTSRADKPSTLGPVGGPQPSLTDL